MSEIASGTVSEVAVSKPAIDLKSHKEFMGKLIDLYGDLFVHDGYGDMRIEMKILRRGQKEVIIHCGKQYRYVMDCDQALSNESPLKALLKRDILA